MACHLLRIRSIMIWKPSWLPEFRTPFGPCNLLRVTGMESGPILGAVCCSSIQRFLSGCCSTKPKATQNRVYNDFDKNYSAKTMIRLKELCLEVGRILISKCAHWWEILRIWFNPSPIITYRYWLCFVPKMGQQQHKIRLQMASQKHCILPDAAKLMPSDAPLP